MRGGWRNYCSHSLWSVPRPRKRPVTDIGTWVECFSVMAAIITLKYPEKAPQLFSYLRMITRASLTFEGPALVSYDAQFRRRAAFGKSWDWGTVDSSLYNECFTGRAKVKILCKHCLSDSHTDCQCPLAAQVPSQASQTPTPPAKTRFPSLGQTRSVELCGLFNKPSGNCCTFSSCRYAHICSLCHLGPHPASTCSKPCKTILPGSGSI